MTKTEANADLCRALGVGPSMWEVRYERHDQDGFYVGAFPAGMLPMATDLAARHGTQPTPLEYPDMSDANLLMAALDAVRLRYNLSHSGAVIWALDCDTHPIKLPDNFPVLLPHGGGDWKSARATQHEPGGHLLFRAACAAFGVQYEATNAN